MNGAMKRRGENKQDPVQLPASNRNLISTKIDKANSQYSLSYKLKLPQLVEADLFGGPDARWLDTYNIVSTGKNSLVINGAEKGTSLVLEAKEGRIVNRIEHDLAGTLFSS